MQAPEAGEPPVDVSVIVVTFNDEEIISRCLTGVRQSVDSHAAEVLVVDNASTDGTLQTISEIARGATVIPLERNVGFSAANNIAMEKARGHYVVLVNSAAFPDPGAIDHLINRAEGNERIGLIGARLRY